MARPAKPLKKVLLKSTVRPEVIKRCTSLIDKEVGKKSGLTGLAIKGGYKIVKNLKGGKMIPEAVDWLLDEFVEQMEPVAADFVKNGGELSDESALTHCFVTEKSTLANALLTVTDSRAQKAKNKIMVDAYKKLRPMALREVEAALPGVASVIAATAKEVKG